MTTKNQDIWDARKAALCSVVTKKQLQHKADQEGFDKVMLLIVEAAKRGDSHLCCYSVYGRWMENMSEYGKRIVWTRLRKLGFNVIHEFPAEMIDWSKPYGEESRPKAPQPFLTRLKEFLSN